ncbi:hypothetical protein [Cohnella terricola]|uniref:Uncharacterized protein n=1 Tax=Cohnella terricola TaxID=1289167 RepID=A0A559J9Z2_9BACL|nr:hypothetical protein [Cohnella terricola]TVX96674.1 hypothetical protein FPZ45_20550 [Cohnella terricola]
MKRIRYGILLLLAAVTILQGCSRGKMDENAPVGIPLIKDVQSIAVLDRDGNIVAEHRELDVIDQLLQGMKVARLSYIGDPEESGDLYEIMITGNGESRTFSINDLRGTDTLGVSVKLYATLPNEQSARAWSLKTAWMQLLLDPAVNEDEPELFVTLNETSDSVILVANRDIDQQSLEGAIQSTLNIRSKTTGGTTNYTLNWTDSRRVVIRFLELPQGATAELMLEGVAAEDGERFHIHAPHDGKVIAIHQGPAWSGLRWVDTSGRTVHEHGFDSAVFIEPLRYEEYAQEIIIYNRDNTAYLFHPEKGEIADGTFREWADNVEAKYGSDYGVNVLYSYPADTAGFFVARGLKTIYRIHSADGKQLPIYEADRPVYGMASSPDGKHIGILVDSESNLGPYADLLVIDAQGKKISEFKKAAYIGHSEGWHLIYPVMWTDNETIAVPLIGSSGESFLRGKALFDYKAGFLSKGENPALPEDAVSLLQSEIDGLDETEITRLLPKPHDELARYYAVFVVGSGSYLIDREEKKVTLLGSGALVTWTSAGQIVVWHSTEGKSVDFVGIE